MVELNLLLIFDFILTPRLTIYFFP